MASRVYLTLGERTIMVARPATYQDLVSEIREHFPDVSAVYSLVVVFQPAVADGSLLQNWVEVAPSAYGAVHDGAELFVNVRRTDGYGNRIGNEPGDYDATAQDDQVSKTRPRGVSSGPRGVSHKFDHSSLSLELERTGGDAFASGWGGASERFRRSTKLVPNLKDCKEAVGQIVGQSNFYPDDEEEQIADIKLGMYQDQDQRPQATEAGWYAGTELAQGDENPGDTEAQHLAGGLEEDQHEGKRTTPFLSNNNNRNWFANSNPPEDSLESFPRSRAGLTIPTAPQWGNRHTPGRAWGGYRTPSPKGWLPYRGNKVPDYVRSRSYSPIHAGAGVPGSNPGEWNDANQEYSRIVAGPGDHPEVGHLTNGTHTNGVTTNGNLTNGNLTNGHMAAHSEVSQYSQHQDQHHGASDWSPLRHQADGYHWPQGPQIQGYPKGSPNPKALAASRPRRDPAEVTYGSPRPRTQGSNSGWTTIGRKKKTWTDNPVQEESDPELAEPIGENNNNAWYAQPSPPDNFHRTTGHGRGSDHGRRGLVWDHANKSRQKQRSGPEMSWGSDHWGGPPPNRTQRGAFTHHETPASKHWQ